MCPVRVSFYLQHLALFSVLHGTGTSYIDICKDRTYLDSCTDLLPPLLTRDGFTGIPNSKRQVDLVCRAFKKGMNCIDTYAHMCMTPGERNQIEENLVGARHTFSFLCDDPLFQSEYLQYAPCYRAVGKNWDSCAARFLKQLQEKPASNTTYDPICCAKETFAKCVLEFGTLRCRSDAAYFLRRIAETLANVHVHHTSCQHPSCESNCPTSQ